jgi:hypothetical protein
MMGEAPYKRRVRTSVQSKVDDILWQLRREDDADTLHATQPRTETRCVICTLPCGSCEHSERWLEARVESRFDAVDECEQEISDLLEVLPARQRPTWKPPEPAAAILDTDLRTLTWAKLDVLLEDRIAGTRLDLSSPRARTGHSAVVCEALLCVFGGLQLRSPRSGPWSYDAVLKDSDLRYLSDVHVYHVYQKTWHAPVPAVSPVGRYGHCAASVSSHEMLVFGGRGEGGHCFNDTWVYDADIALWTEARGAADTLPSARYFAAMVVCSRTLVIFGGTDGQACFQDVFTMELDRPCSTWVCKACFGEPPQARYGHAMVTLAADLVAVLGGCVVPPGAELDAGIAQKDLARLALLARGVQGARRNESVYVLTGSSSLSSTAFTSTRGMLREAARKTDTVRALEEETRAAEAAFLLASVDLDGLRYMSQARSKHTPRYLDVLFLDIKKRVWRAALERPSGRTPLARMLFRAEAVGDKVVIFGGCEPSCRASAPLEDHLVVYELDARTMRWRAPAVLDTPAFLAPALRAAGVELRRSIRRMEAEKARGLSVGVPGGLTLEHAEAEALQHACRWRLVTLQGEAERLRPPPEGRWAAAGALVGARIITHGGWTSAGASGETVVLDLEHALERFARVEKETMAMLERARKAHDSKGRRQHIESAHECRAKRAAERAAEERERDLMGVEDRTSRLPPLTVAPAPRIVKVNQHTVWLRWPQVHPKPESARQSPGSVTYILRMQGGFTPLRAGDQAEVLVDSGAATSAPQWACASVRVAYADGSCDIRYADGSLEARVHVERLRSPEHVRCKWHVVYIGPGASSRAVRSPAYATAVCVQIPIVQCRTSSRIVCWSTAAAVKYTCVLRFKR